MTPDQIMAINMALDWINANYEVVGIVVSGSIIRGNGNANSDLDIYVIHNSPFRQGVQKFFNGTPCEIFINNIEHINSYFDEECRDNRPTTAHMLSTGVIYQGVETPEIISLVEKANTYATKPATVDDRKIMFARYDIALLFEDATDLYQTDSATALYFLNKAVDALISFAFPKYQMPMPRPKERLAFLKQKDPVIGKLTEDYFLKTDVSEKHSIAGTLITKLIGHTGFFEWETEQE